jgi:CRP-like cAMP-binding protein
MQLVSFHPGHLSDDDFAVLKSIPFFSVVPPEEREEAFRGLRRRRFGKGEVVYHQDDPPGSLFIVVAGSVKMERTFNNGRQHTIAWITKGNFFGTHSLFGSATRTETAVSITQSEVLVFDGSEFRSFLHRNPPAMEALLELVIGKWRGCMERFSETALLDVRERTARVLVRLAQRVGCREKCGEVSLPDLTQPELASWVGATRETVNRSLKALARMGLIEVRGGIICVLDVKGLANLE